MRIAFLTYGTAPIPATKGGAVENLIEDLLDENEKHHEFDMSVLSLHEEKAEERSKQYKYTDFHFVKCPKVVDLLDRYVYWIAKNILKKENLISYRYIFRRLYVMSKYPKILLKEDYDRIIMVTNATLFLVLKNKKVAAKYKDKVIYYLHNEVRSLFKCHKQAASIRSLIGISEFVNKSFRKQVPEIKESQSYVLKNCIDTESFTRNVEDKITYYRKKLGISKKDFVVIFAGRIVKEKGVLEVIQAVKKCDNKNIKLLIVGGGFYSTDLNDSYTISLHKEAEDIKEQIIFSGYVDYCDMPALYKLSNIAVLPSIWEEPAGMTMVEAVISGTPLITTRSGGIPEYIPGNAAILLNKDSRIVEELSNAICKLMNDSNLRNQLAQVGAQLSLEFNLDNYFKNFKRIIKEC